MKNSARLRQFSQKESFFALVFDKSTGNFYTSAICNKFHVCRAGIDDNNKPKSRQWDKANDYLDGVETWAIVKFFEQLKYSDRN